jgi:hypothetical protein
MEDRKTVSTLELIRLLHELKDYGTGICFRFRLIGEMWYPNFTQVVFVHDSKVLVFDDSINKNIFVRDISNIMQFELDKRFQNYQPYFHYDVQPMKEFSFGT